MPALMFISFCFLMGLRSSAFAESNKPKNFCTNGGFEELSPWGFPAGWGGFAGAGGSFGVSRDAHSGNYALLLKSTSATVVGVNRNQDALMPIIRGVARFWYKAVSSEVDGKNLQICIIAMNESGQQEVARQIYTVPAEHVGDGQWHLAEIEFDFRSREDARLIHFAPRINETSSEKGSGEFLLDDVEVAYVGLRVEKFGAAKSLIGVGETVNVCLVVKNDSDQEVTDCEGKLFLPDGVVISSGESHAFHIKKLQPDESMAINWQITGEKPMFGRIAIAIDSSLSSPFFLTVVDLSKPELRLANEYVCLEFFKTEHGYGVFTLNQVHSDIPVAHSLMFGCLVHQTYNNTIMRIPLFAEEVEQQNGRYIFKNHLQDIDMVTWDFEFIFDLPPGQKWVNVTCRATAEKERKILAFYAPGLYTDRHNRYDAIFPGLEFLEDGEISSSTLDITTPNHIRRVPHPHKITIPLTAVSENVSDGTVITGMMWDAKKKWSKDFDCPSVLFASPNWFECMEDYDVMSLFVPSVPNWVKENQTQATTPYSLQPEDPVEISAQLFSIHKPEPDVSAVYAIQYWIEKYGLPQPLSLPRNTPERELEFSLTAYMDTLWVSEEEGWHYTLDWDPWGPAMNNEFARQLWFASKILPDAPRKAEYLKRAELAFRKLGYNLGKDLPFYIGKLDQIYPGYKGAIADLIRTQKADGSWEFDPDWWNANDQIQHQDYHKLGKKGDVEVGICAQKAYILLNYARMTGDRVSLEAGLRSLDFMRRFRIPRAAQVWEVPVHTPDILASAHAVQAYLEAYRITDDQSYLDSAVYWAHAGLPFVYLWNNDNMPYMLYASIPVFGATWFTGSWFGVAVQWNGLDYAYALFDLAQYDDSLPWETIARGLTTSALYQQETSEKYKGLYPDSYNFMDKTKSAWKLSPNLIVRNLFVMMGYPAEPRTAIVRKGNQTIHVNAIVPIEEPELSDTALTFWLNYPAEMDGYIMIAGLGRPDRKAVMKNQQVLEEVNNLDSVPEGWKYDIQSGLLFIKLKRDSGRMKILISNPRLRYFSQIPPTVEKINWQFSQDGLHEWTPLNHLDELNIEEGALTTRSTGSDPYMACLHTRIKASEYTEIAIRMKTSRGNTAQLFWATETDPLSESTSMRFQIQSDGKFHDYIVPVGKHDKWKGVITTLRLDPTDSSDCEIAVENITGRYAPQTLPSDKKINWHFNQGVLYDWIAMNNLAGLRIQEGALVSTSTGSDPYMVCSYMKIDASEYSEIVIRMKTNRGNVAQFFWATETEPFSEPASIRFPIHSDGIFHDYVIPVAQHYKWKGIITSLRLDPTDSADCEIAVESITGNYACIKGDVNADGSVESNDAILALRISTGHAVPTPQQKCSADMNSDGEIRADDAIIILRNLAGLGAPSRAIHDKLWKSLSKRVLGASPLELPLRKITVALDKAYGSAGKSITVPVRIDNTDSIAGGDICIAYDDRILRAVDVTSETGTLLVSNLTEPGIIHIAFASSDRLNSKTIAMIRFDVLADNVSPLAFKSVKLYNSDALPLSSISRDEEFRSWAMPPEQSALLQNFPNPFNPDTWIPYQLKKDSDVAIKIFSVSGELVRELELGHKFAGLYINQDRAAYWDGKNESGEDVANGVYFYNIRAGDFSTVKKLIVLR